MYQFMGYKNLKINGLAIFSFTCLIIYKDPSAELHTLMAYLSPFENPRKMNRFHFFKNGVSCLLVLEGLYDRGYKIEGFQDRGGSNIMRVT